MSEYGDVWLNRAREIPRAPPPSIQQPRKNQGGDLLYSATQRFVMQLDSFGSQHPSFHAPSDLSSPTIALNTGSLLSFTGIFFYFYFKCVPFLFSQNFVLKYFFLIKSLEDQLIFKSIQFQSQGDFNHIYNDICGHSSLVLIRHSNNHIHVHKKTRNREFFIHSSGFRCLIFSVDFSLEFYILQCLSYIKLLLSRV